MNLLGTRDSEYSKNYIENFPNAFIFCWILLRSMMLEKSPIDNFCKFIRYP